MKHPDLVRWKEMHGVDLEIGLEVCVSPNCQYYEPMYDKGMKAKIVEMHLDGYEIGTVKIGISDSVPVNSEMSGRTRCEMDGYTIDELFPAPPVVVLNEAAAY